MDELIEELFEKYATERRNNVSILFTDFQQAIQTACKAQRNACAREFRHNRRNIGLSVAEKSIKNAEIERCDYE